MSSVPPIERTRGEKQLLVELVRQQIITNNGLQPTTQQWEDITTKFNASEKNTSRATKTEIAKLWRALKFAAEHERQNFGDKVLKIPLLGPIDRLLRECSSRQSKNASKSKKASPSMIPPDVLRRSKRKLHSAGSEEVTAEANLESIHLSDGMDDSHVEFQNQLSVKRSKTGVKSTKPNRKTVVNNVDIEENRNTKRQEKCPARSSTEATKGLESAKTSISRPNRAIAVYTIQNSVSPRVNEAMNRNKSLPRPGTPYPMFVKETASSSTPRPIFVRGTTSAGTPAYFVINSFTNSEIARNIGDSEVVRSIDIGAQAVSNANVSVNGRLLRKDFVTVLDDLAGMRVVNDLASIKSNPGLIADTAMLANINGRITNFARGGSLLIPHRRDAPKLATLSAGMVANNVGMVSNNVGMVANNAGMVANNVGMVANNDGMVANNDGMVANNDGMVANNAGITANNSGGEANDVSMMENDAGIVASNAGMVTSNTGMVANNSAVVVNGSGMMENNAEVVTNKAGMMMNNAGVMTNSTDVVAATKKLVRIPRLKSPILPRCPNLTASGVNGQQTAQQILNSTPEKTYLISSSLLKDSTNFHVRNEVTSQSQETRLKEEFQVIRLRQAKELHEVQKKLHEAQVTVDKKIAEQSQELLDAKLRSEAMIVEQNCKFEEAKFKLEEEKSKLEKKRLKQSSQLDQKLHEAKMRSEALIAKHKSELQAAQTKVDTQVVQQCQELHEAKMQSEIEIANHRSELHASQMALNKKVVEQSQELHDAKMKTEALIAEQNQKFLEEKSKLQEEKLKMEEENLKQSLALDQKLHEAKMRSKNEIAKQRKELHAANFKAIQLSMALSQEVHGIEMEAARLRRDEADTKNKIAMLKLKKVELELEQLNAMLGIPQ